MHQIARYMLAAIFLCVFAEGTAYAQLEKRFAVGVSVANFEPEASELDAKMRIVPTISRVPRPGWGIALALNWYEADVNDFVGVHDLNDGQLGKINVRPFMAGVGYTIMRGPLSITPSIVAGPAWNRLEVDDDITDLFFVSKEGDDDFGDKADVISFAVRPGLSATYAVTSRFGITGFAGYLFNRPKFDVVSAFNNFPTRTEWNADGLALSAGIVVPVF
jgi:hypothetical protein